MALYCGIDLHSTNHWLTVIDEADRCVFERRLSNDLAVMLAFLDAQALSDSEMQALARETSLEETAFVIPREPAVEREHGVKVRIFTPDQEIPFGGHPALGTAVVLRNRLMRKRTDAQIILDLKVGEIPVTFRDDPSGAVFGEMQQVEPVFGQVHERETVAAILGIRPEDIVDEGPIQTVSTGLAFVIVPLKSLRTLQALSPDFKKAGAYFAGSTDFIDFFYITRDTQDPSSDLRARGLYATGEDSGNRLGCRLHRGLDGSQWRGQVRPGCSYRARCGDRAAQPHFRPCGKTRREGSECSRRRSCR